METKEFTPKNMWAKDDDTCLKRLNHSVKGDEVVVRHSEEKDGKTVNRYTNYVAVGDGTFKKAQVSAKKYGDKVSLSMKLEGEALTADDVLKAMPPAENRQVFWNRKKLLSKEVDSLEAGKTMTNYGAISKEYNPKKRIADMQLSVAAFLQTVSPNAEINYYKYSDGKKSGIDTYLCTNKYEFVRLNKEIVKEEPKERLVKADNSRKYSVWDIVNTLPKQERQLSPNRDIDLKCRWNKYNQEEVARLLKGESLNDTEIEQRRKDYLRSHHYFVPKPMENGVLDGTKLYTECWVDKETGELLRVRNRKFTIEKSNELLHAGQIKMAKDIPAYYEKLSQINIVKHPKDNTLER